MKEVTQQRQFRNIAIDLATTLPSHLAGVQLVYFADKLCSGASWNLTTKDDLKRKWK